MPLTDRELWLAVEPVVGAMTAIRTLTVPETPGTAAPYDDNSTRLRLLGILRQRMNGCNLEDASAKLLELLANLVGHGPTETPAAGRPGRSRRPTPNMVAAADPALDAAFRQQFDALLEDERIQWLTRDYEFATDMVDNKPNVPFSSKQQDWARQLIERYTGRTS